MQIGFIGLGTMGASMAANLQRDGRSLVVHDLDRSTGEALVAGGATWADSPAAVARRRPTWCSPRSPARPRWRRWPWARAA